ncbi:hypothetical protein ILUMI_23528 [Ignelater luminosus]|uniref:Reverse transcriptase/retrotransposon-derived protein RNase H-like domain-containing protein n=1 Tax=Ignelater luminosus TaxID=2038154 RepID=A0A8K0G1T2_IGNLU|nr:hypothetical protein ILUMI_23528 [Ignelater luminosus]
MKHMNQTEKDTAKLNIIKDQWIAQYKELWCKQEDAENNDTNSNDERDFYGRSSSDNICRIKRLIEKRRELHLETYIASIGSQKAFDQVDRSKLWAIMNDSSYPQHLIWAIKSLYRETKIVINTELLSQKPVLQYFNERQPIVLSVESSKEGLRTALLKNNAPVAYASKTLIWCKYAQTEKEILPIIFDCQTFDQYFYVKYKPGSQLHLADVLSGSSENDEISQLIEFQLETQISSVNYMIVSPQKF